MRILVAALAVLSLMVAAPTDAFAQDPEALVAEATEFFQAGAYEEAIELFEQAFELDPHPVIMFNLARAYQESGDLPAALLHFRNIRTMDAPSHVLEAAETKIIDVEDLLMEQGYNPNTITSSDYVPRGTVTITTQPEGAMVYLDGQYQGTTPFQRELVNENVYALRVELEGYHPITQNVDVRGLRNNLRSFNLTPRTTLEEYVPPSPGYLTVRAPVSGLEVEIDGEFFGYTPVLAQGLAPGTYVVSINDENWVAYSSTVDVVSGSETEVIARMAALNATDITDPNRGRRNAGTALMATSGAVIAGGAVLGILASNAASDYRDNPEDPDRGTYRDTAKRNALMADIAFGTGGALFVTGALLRWVNAGPSDDVDSDLLVRPTTGPGLGLGVSASW